MSVQIAVPPQIASLAVLDRVHYQDAFAIDTSSRRTPEEWARLTFEQGPQPILAMLRRLFSALGFRLAPLDVTDQVFGWRIEQNGPDEFVLATQSGLGVTARIIFLTPPGQVVLATLIRLDTRLARAVWTVAAPMHRLTVGYLMDHLFANDVRTRIEMDR